MVFYDAHTDENYKDVEYAEGTDWVGIICPKFEGHQRAGNRIGPMKINLRNKNKGDFLWTFLSESIISDKVANIFKENKLTGYELKEVELQNMSSHLKLWELIIIGKGGEAHKDSGIHLKEYCEYCGKKKYSAYENGIIVDLNNWDRSDLFTVVGYPRHILVTEKVRNMVIKNKFTGIKFTPSHELKWPQGVIKP